MLSAAWTIATKDLKLLLRDPAAAFFTLVFPLGVAILFGSIFGGRGEQRQDLALAVWLGERTDAAERMARALESAKGLAVSRAESRAAGEEAVRKGRATALVVIPEGFGRAADLLFFRGAMRLEAVVDPARGAEAGLITGKLNELAFKQIASGITDPARSRALLAEARGQLATARFSDPLMGPTLGRLFDALDAVNAQTERAGAADGDVKGAGGGFSFQPVEVTVTELERRGSAGPRSGFELSFPQGVVWGLMGCAMGFAVSIASERAAGTLVRLTVAPLRRGTILLGKAMACFMACAIVQALLLTMGVLVFGVGVSSWPLMLAAVVCSSLAFVGVATLLAGLSPTEQGAGGMARAILIVLAMIGGGSVPMMFLPPWMQTASSISPFKWALLSFEGATFREYSAADMALPCGVLLAFGIGGWLVGVRGLTRQRAF
ncbi:MAG: ABC transporter permease [Phycisphaerae bacterium]|nr:ABC transporter permease [Phycisphaerae bacterium]